MTTPTLNQALEELANLGLKDPDEIVARLVSEHDDSWVIEQTNGRKILRQRVVEELRRLDRVAARG